MREEPFLSDATFLEFNEVSMPSATAETTWTPPDPQDPSISWQYCEPRYLNPSEFADFSEIKY